MRASPLVTVVLPTHDRAAFLPQAMASVLAQTMPDWELIVVDDGSRDDTRAVLAKHCIDARIRVVTQAHRGSAAACNHGLSLSRGQFVAFHGSDDWWEPYKLQVGCEALQAASDDVGVHYSDMLRVPANGDSFPHLAPRPPNGTLIDESSLDFAVMGIGNGAALVRKACFDAVGAFDEQLPRFLDLDWFIRASERYRFVHDNRLLVHWRANPGISSNGRSLVNARLQLLDKHRPRLAAQRRYLAGQYFHLGIASHRAGQSLNAIQWGARALAACPDHPIVREQAVRLMARTVRSKLREA